MHCSQFIDRQTADFAGQSVRHHMLTNYFHAILTVILNQFTGLGFADGMDGVVRLTEASPYIRVTLILLYFPSSMVWGVCMHVSIHIHICALLQSAIYISILWRMLSYLSLVSTLGRS